MLTQNVDLRNKTVLVTGAAGFIGSNLVTELLNTVSPIHIVGIDNMNDYYDVSIKEYRLSKIEELAKDKKDSKWTFVKGNIADTEEVRDTLDILDIVRLNAFAGGADFDIELDIADTDESGVIDLADLTWIRNFILRKIYG